jgi:hypothetical protein
MITNMTPHVVDFIVDGESYRVNGEGVAGDKPIFVVYASSLSLRSGDLIKDKAENDRLLSQLLVMAKSDNIPMRIQ